MCSGPCLKFRVAEEGRQWEEQGRVKGEELLLEEMLLRGSCRIQPLPYAGQVR